MLLLLPPYLQTNTGSYTFLGERKYLYSKGGGCERKRMEITILRYMLRIEHTANRA